MATFRIIAWRDIPASVEAQDGQEQVTVPLSERFQALIDTVAMRTGAHQDDSYLEAWDARAGERPGSARDVGAAIAAELEARFPEFTQRALGPA
jgi:cvfA/B/C family virulence factor